jgi:hypothetical protein
MRMFSPLTASRPVSVELGNHEVGASAAVGGPRMAGVEAVAGAAP